MGLLSLNENYIWLFEWMTCLRISFCLKMHSNFLHKKPFSCEFCSIQGSCCITKTAYKWVDFFFSTLLACRSDLAPQPCYLKMMGDSYRPTVADAACMWKLPSACHGSLLLLQQNCYHNRRRGQTGIRLAATELCIWQLPLSARKESKALGYPETELGYPDLQFTITACSTQQNVKLERALKDTLNHCYGKKPGVCQFNLSSICELPINKFLEKSQNSQSDRTVQCFIVT